MNTEAETKEKNSISNEEPKEKSAEAPKSAPNYGSALQVNYLRAIAQAHAKTLNEHNITPDEWAKSKSTETGEDVGVKKEADIRETQDANYMRAAAKVYARNIIENDLTPRTYKDENLWWAEPTDEESGKAKKQKQKKKRKHLIKIKEGKIEKSAKGISFLSAVIDKRDSLQRGLDDHFIKTSRAFATTTHKIVASYKNTRRIIAYTLLSVCVISATILILFDRFTVYEYAYNGKVLGYVREQNEVTDVLEIAGEKLTENTGSSLDIKFVPNQNVTFNLVDAGDKSLDDADIAVNKLVYMTDIESEAYGIYDGDDLVAIVKSSEDADMLLNETMSELSQTDNGMELVSAEFDNVLETKPLNVLLTSVQDSTSALEQMTKGGMMEIYHIVEEGENKETLMADYVVSAADIYDDNNEKIAENPEIGDKVCIHRTVNPVSVTMEERGRMREVVEFKTVKKETDELYKGDTYVEQEGRNGSQIFEGTIIKKSGEVVERKGEIIEQSPKVRDKIILVGTAERPKTAPTGTYAMPIRSYTYTSRFGYRWGRLHSGVDLAAPTGTPIYATDGGTVIRAGYYSSYGNCVDIDHGNGRVTRYAHCSRILVSVGEMVYQGQNIALVGNTGHSFGSHLHFEVRLNGTAVDPAPKLGIQGQRVYE